MALYVTVSIAETGILIVDRALDGSLCNFVYRRNRYIDKALAGSLCNGVHRRLRWLDRTWMLEIFRSWCRV